ncbi:MAG: SPOR domain-containing protein [Balneolaceae bacterium]|nr:SPOR domain-containing protein [Balneolaceae bacterium]
MHIDHQKLLELLTEASGLDAEKAEEQLKALVAEIQQSLSEDEAYEIEGFGIFSSLGNRVMFIPSKELETEINFKYVGMEPIEIDEPAPSFDDPFEGLDDDDDDANEIDLEAKKPVGKDLGTRFAGLIDDDIKDPDLEPAEGPGPEMWGVEAHKETESADRLFASLMGQEYEEPADEEGDVIDTSDEDDFSGLDNIFDDDDDSSGLEDLDSEVAAFMGGDSSTDSEENEKDTDDFLDDVFAEMESDGLESEEVTEDTLNLEDSDVVIDYAEVPKDSDTDDEDNIISADLNSISEQDDEPSLNDPLGEEDEFPEFDLDELEDDAESPAEVETDDEMDFEDPFLNLEDDQVDESVLRMEEFDDTEIVPVIKNITTNDPNQPKKEEPKAEKPEEEKKVVTSNKEPAPTWLWIVLVLVVIGGGVVGLGYFNIISIPFISSDSTTVATTSQPATQTSPPPPVAEETTTAEESSTNEEPPAEPTPQEEAPAPVEQPTQPEVTNSRLIENATSNDVAKYGLTGTLSEAGMDGYTIVMYSLSNQQNARSEQQKLLDDGYRAMVVPIESERYGTLWRVSLGQFASLFDAAVAAEDIESLLPDNYFIKKIN